MSVRSPAPAKTSKSAEPPAHAPSAVAQVEPAGSDLGNLALQDFMAGRLLAKLRVGGASDPEEREADALANSVMAASGPSPCACGSSCPKCGGGGSGATI